MILHDMNQSWVQPKDMKVSSVRADGSYLRVEFRTSLVGPPLSEKTVVVFINDMGREVMRTECIQAWPMLPELPKPDLTSRWVRFKNGFFMVLIGLEEMCRCLNK